MDSRPGGQAERMSDLPSPQENANARTKVLRLQAENAHLKAEVERLRNLATKIDVCVDVLVLENGLLRKAGDAMAVEVNGRYFGKRLIKDWNAAKEGKPSV